MSELITLYTVNMCNLLYVNHILTELFLKHERKKQINLTWTLLVAPSWGGVGGLCIVT